MRHGVPCSAAVGHWQNPANGQWELYASMGWHMGSKIQMYSLIFDYSMCLVYRWNRNLLQHVGTFAVSTGLVGYLLICSLFCTATWYLVFFSLTYLCSRYKFLFQTQVTSCMWEEELKTSDQCFFIGSVKEVTTEWSTVLLLASQFLKHVK